MKRKAEFVHKTTLLLDLDETVFIALSDAQLDAHGSSAENIKKCRGIHPKHTLSSGIKSNGHYIFVLNPERLKAMIEAVYKQGDDIVIFTTGLWLSSVLNVVASLCNLDAEVALKFQNSLFLNPQHDGDKLGYSAEATRTLLKGYRLHGLFRSVETLRRRHFVLLDNEPGHINSCSDAPYITGVLATTKTDDKSFYDAVLKALQLAHANHASLSPAAASYHFPNAALSAFIELEKNNAARPPML